MTLEARSKPSAVTILETVVCVEWGRCKDDRGVELCRDECRFFISGISCEKEHCVS